MSREPLDRSLATWLRDQTATPTYLDEVLERTQRQRQRPAWSFLERWIPMQLTMRPAYVPRQLLLLVVLALLVMAVAVTFVTIGSSRVVVPPFGVTSNGMIAFDRNGEIVVATPDGTQVSEIVTTIPAARGPVFAPDGSRFAFYATVNGKHALMVSQADGREPVALSDGLALTDFTMETPVSWSPDSSQVVFSAVVDDEPHLFVAAADGTNTHRLGDSPLSQIDPAWSPDGQWIGFHGFDPASASTAGQYRTTAGLYLVRPSGLDERQLVVGTGGDFIYRKPQWLPDPGRAVLAYPVGEPGEYDIAMYDVEAEREIAFPRDSTPELWPVWAPDGSALAWDAGGRGIRLGAIDGTIIRTIPPKVDYQFVWSPDGRYLLGPAKGMPGKMAVMAVDGSGEPTIITVGGTSRSHWSWQRQAP